MRTRAQRALVLVMIGIRAAYCAYALAVVGANLGSFQRPLLGLATLLLAIGASGVLGLAAWRRQRFSGPVALADVVVAVLVLAGQAQALSPGDRAGSRNWALAYCVGCAIWLGLGEGRAWRAALAVALGLGYAGSVLLGSAPIATGLAVTALVNAISPPVYFAIAVMAFDLVSQLADTTDRIHAEEREQSRQAAVLAERERLVREVHEPVAAALELLAQSSATESERRLQARCEAAVLRHVISKPTGSFMRAMSLELVRRLTSAGWAVEVVDEEVLEEPSPNVVATMFSALTELLPKPPLEGGRSELRIRVTAQEGWTEIVLRIPGGGGIPAEALDRAQAQLRVVEGTIQPKPALPGEVRLALRAPGLGG